MTLSSSTIRILAVDDHPVLRDGLAVIIGSQPDMQFVGEASTGAEALAQFRSLRPDVTLMDMRLPDMHGVAVIEAIRRESPNARVIVLTTYQGDIQAMRALRAGARGFLLKATLRLDLLDAIRTVHAGGLHVPPDVASDLAVHTGVEALSQRELQVLQQLAEGSSNKAIALTLGISEDTVKTHMRAVLSKLNANDRTHAVIIGMKRGFIDI